MNPIVEEHTVLQLSSDRDDIVELFLDDLTTSSETTGDEKLKQPEWGAVYHIGSHLAVKHPDYAKFFREAGEPDYNIYHVSFDDLLTVLEEYDTLVLKTAAYESVDEKFLRYEAFEHRLNDDVVPSNSTVTRFITISESNNRPELWCTSATPDSVGPKGTLVDAENETVPFHKLPELLEDATSLYLTDSNVIPPSLTRGHLSSE